MFRQGDAASFAARKVLVEWFIDKRPRRAGRSKLLTGVDPGQR
jgi:hypothetical protein